MRFLAVLLFCAGATRAQPRLFACQETALSGTTMPVCGRFPEGLRTRLLLDADRELQPLASSESQLLILLPDDAEPGTHSIRFAPPGEDAIYFQLLRVRAAIDNPQMTGRAETRMRLIVEGTQQPLRFELTNHDPDLVRLEGGDRHTAQTSGGGRNTLVRRLTKVAFVPGQARSFRLNYRLESQNAACPAEYELTQARVVALLAAGADPAALAASYSLTLLEQSALASLGSEMAVFGIPDGRSPAAVAALLAGDPRIQAAQPDFVYVTLAQGPLSYAREMVGADLTAGQVSGEGVAVAVIDTGMPGEGRDFTGQGWTEDLHGTAVQGILKDDVAPGVRIIGLKACRPASSTALRADCFTSWLVRALDAAIAGEARVINMSIGGTAEDPLLARLVQTADDRNKLVVAAAGNGGPSALKFYPAAFATTLAVTAVDARRELFRQATTGDFVDLAAPGVDILVRGPRGMSPLCTGTSFAAPFASGISALVLEKHPALRPSELRQLIEGTALDLGAPGKDPQFGSGLVDACAALARASGGRVRCQTKR